MTLAIDLLGPPRVLRDGQERAGPRGRKTWGLLAYLVLADRPPSRARLAELLFPDADDPLGAVRWSLSELRRTLGPDFMAEGDPVVVSFTPATSLDVDVVRRGPWARAVDLPDLGRDLLEGVAVSGSAGFEIWLTNARHGLAGAAEAALHTAATACLARGAATEALAHAARLVELHPLDEAHHVLLVQCRRATGDLSGAVEQARRSADLVRRELGREASPALADAAHPPTGADDRRPGSVPAMLEVAEAAIAAGAISQGLATLAEATTLARRGAHRELLARVLLARGHALVHVGRGGDQEGAALLHEAAAVAAAVDPLVAAAAHRDLAFADLQRGRYGRALAEVATARRLATGDDAELCWVEALAGACLTDQGRYGPALEALRSAVRRAEDGHSPVGALFAQSFVGRLHVLRGELADAVEVLTPAVAQAPARWRAWLPWLESMLAEAELAQGHLDQAEHRLERAFVMGRQLDDPCFESLATRGLGLIAVARGRVRHGYELLVEAPGISRRLPDSYLWIEAFGLDALCGVAVEHRPTEATRWVGQLHALAARCGMRELLVRAMLHRARLGEPGALDAATELAGTVDNPALHAEVAAVAERTSLTRHRTRTPPTM